MTLPECNSCPTGAATQVLHHGAPLLPLPSANRPVAFLRLPSAGAAFCCCTRIKAWHYQHC